MSSKLNGSKYCYVSLAIQLNMSHLFTHTWMIKQFYIKQFCLVHIFVYTQLDLKIVLFQTIQFNINTQFKC